ncbi:hypothetical protein KAR91_46910 [Candidatus Pacearchaeota archaeon]|nr:hypothetical protein [Candidatus Pacearchaeota archaeon]
MAKGVFNKSQALNKRIVQEIIYKWISKKFGDRKFPTAIIILPGDNPLPSLLLYKKHFYKPIIHAFENSHKTFVRLKTKTFDKIDFRLHNKNVKEAFDYMGFEDLDFCTNFFSKRTRRLPNLSHTDTFAILRRRLALMVTSTANFKHYKVFMFTVSLRNGLGKMSTVTCLESLIYLTGHKLDYIDGMDPDDPRGYGEGNFLINSGCKHPNGKRYYAYEHDVLFKPSSDLYSKRGLEMRMFTYTDGTPMLTFAMLFK